MIKSDKTKWRPSTAFTEKYDLYSSDFKQMRENGIPFKVIPGKRQGKYLYREKDINDYFAGLIGKDVERRNKNDK